MVLLCIVSSQSQHSYLSGVYFSCIVFLDCPAFRPVELSLWARLDGFVDPMFELYRHLLIVLSNMTPDTSLHLAHSVFTMWFTSVHDFKHHGIYCCDDLFLSHVSRPYNARNASPVPHLGCVQSSFLLIFSARHLAQ